MYPIFWSSAWETHDWFMHYQSHRHLHNRNHAPLIGSSGPLGFLVLQTTCSVTWQGTSVFMSVRTRETAQVEGYRVPAWLDCSNLSDDIIWLAHMVYPCSWSWQYIVHTRAALCRFHQITQNAPRPLAWGQKKGGKGRCTYQLGTAVKLSSTVQ